MTRKNKFGFAPVEAEVAPARRSRSPGPMGAAVRDVAENLTETTEAKVEQRRRNAEDAKAYRAAQDAGHVLMELPVGNIATDALPRDRIELDAVATSDEMDELKSSIRARGQKEPIEVYEDATGRFQLVKGWRRLTALRQLLDETGDARFGKIVARVAQGQGDRLLRYVDMVEENVVREDLTFAEMAQVAIKAAEDEAVDETDSAQLVGRLYGALHKTKRSYIRSFVHLLVTLGDDLKFPKAVSRNLGVDVARALPSAEGVQTLRTDLAGCADPDAQGRVLAAFLAEKKGAPGVKAKTVPKQKFEFFVGQTKVTARAGELRLVSEADFVGTPKHRLEKAVKAFEAALKEGLVSD